MIISISNLPTKVYVYIYMYRHFLFKIILIQVAASVISFICSKVVATETRREKWKLQKRQQVEKKKLNKVFFIVFYINLVTFR